MCVTVFFLVVPTLSDPVFYPAPTGVVKPRLNILDLQKVPKQFALFIRALNNITQPGYTYEGSDAVNWEQLGL